MRNLLLVFLFSLSTFASANSVVPLPTPSPFVQLYGKILDHSGFAKDPRKAISLAKFEKAVVARAGQITAATGRAALNISMIGRSTAFAVIVGTVMVNQGSALDIKEDFTKWISAGQASAPVTPPSGTINGCTAFGAFKLCSLPNGTREITYTRTFSYSGGGAGIHPPGWAPYFYGDTGTFEWDPRQPNNNRFTENQGLRSEAGDTRTSVFVLGIQQGETLPEVIQQPSEPTKQGEHWRLEDAAEQLKDTGNIKETDRIPDTTLNQMLPPIREMLSSCEGCLPIPRVVPPEVMPEINLPAPTLLEPAPTEPATPVESAEGGIETPPTLNAGDKPNWDDPNTAAPAIGEAGDILEPIQGLLDSLSPFKNVNIQLEGSCQPLTIHFLEQTASTDAHCVLTEEQRPLFFLIFTAIWSFIAIRIFMEA